MMVSAGLGLVDQHSLAIYQLNIRSHQHQKHNLVTSYEKRRRINVSGAVLLLSTESP